MSDYSESRPVDLICAIVKTVAQLDHNYHGNWKLSFVFLCQDGRFCLFLSILGREKKCSRSYNCFLLPLLLTKIIIMTRLCWTKHFLDAKAKWQVLFKKLHPKQLLFSHCPTLILRKSGITHHYKNWHQNKARQNLLRSIFVSKQFLNEEL